MKHSNVSKPAAKRALSILGIALLALPGLFAADSLSEPDRQEGLAQLARTRDALVAATNRLSEAQWKFKPAPDRWSIAEILEHIGVTEDFLFEMTSNKVMQAPAGSPDRDLKRLDALVLKAIADRSTRVQAPEPVRPQGGKEPKELLDHFLASRARTELFLKSTPGLRDHVMVSPLGQPLDAYQWLLYISAHADRHTKQILEVKTDPGFPKKQQLGEGFAE